MSSGAEAMIPIHELLNRIKWDAEFGHAQFTVGYCDRFEKNIIEVPLKELHFDKNDHFGFEIIDDMGETHSIPLHRIREVHRNGQLIWHRDSPGTSAE